MQTSSASRVEDVDGAAEVPVSILVVSYNTREETLECLASVVEATQGTAYELIVVDNDSTDGSTDAIEEQFPAIQLLRSPQNVGFGAANNLAAQHARGRRLLLLNPDTLVRVDAVTRIVRFADEHPDARLWGGRTIALDGSLNIGSCWGAPTLWSTFCRAVGLSSVFPRVEAFHREALGDWQRDSVREVDIVAGCFLLIDRGLWNDLGGFHPDFFMYGEDIDLSLRAGRLGARPLICPEAEIVHLCGVSERVRSAKLVRLFTARAQLYRKFWNPTAAWLGVRLIELRVLTRIAGTALLAPLRARSRSSLSEWLQVWRERATWRRAFRTTKRYERFDPGAWAGDRVRGTSA
ncbi:MAG: glycosyltransferase family 2 protein [Planctomycetota bacterium]